MMSLMCAETKSIFMSRNLVVYNNVLPNITTIKINALIVTKLVMSAQVLVILTVSIAMKNSKFK